MQCPNCGQPAVSPDGLCGNCGVRAFDAPPVAPVQPGPQDYTPVYGAGPGGPAYGAPQPAPGYGYGYYAPPFQGVTQRRPISGLGTATQILLALNAAAVVVMTIAFAWRASLLGKFLNDPLSADLSSIRTDDNLVRAATVIWVLVFLATAVVFVCWFYAARKNAETYDSVRMSLGKGWAIGGWFIPLASLVLPCLVARDIHKGTTADARRGVAPSGGAITGVWWALYVLANLATYGGANTNSNGTSGTETNTQSLQDLKSTAQDILPGLVFMVAAAVAAIFFVRKITTIQKARAGEPLVGQGPFAPAPYGMPPYGAPYGGAPYGQNPNQPPPPQVW